MKFGAYRDDILRNVFPRNPIQTAYLRFQELPDHMPKTAWDEAQKQFEERMKLPDLTKTYYTDLLEGDDE